MKKINRVDVLESTCGSTLDLCQEIVFNLGPD